MINQIPESWQYNDSLEMLLLFYQASDELLSEMTPDSYALPLHNSVTLLYEMSEVYNLLEQHGALKYYEQYIPPIIEEFLFHTEEDYLFKQLLGSRLESIRTGFKEAEKTPAHFQAWIDNVNQACTLRKYFSAYKEEIIRLISSTKDKTKLLYCASNYYITLRWIGYSREYLYTSVKKYFSNRNKCINDKSQISEFLDLFGFSQERYEFLILLDVDSIEYMDSISDNLVLSNHIEKIDLTKGRAELEKDQSASELLKEYDARVHQAGAHTKMSIVHFYDDDFDPYSAAQNFCDYISFLQTFARYFKHFYFSKQVYKILQKLENGHYREIKLPSKLQKRPFVEQEIIDSRIRNILSAKAMNLSAFNSITQAIEMHAEAFDSRSTTTLLKTFWTALETLFSNPNPTSTRENVINSVLPIIQKTYILKKLRAIYVQLVEASTAQDRISLHIEDFQKFIMYYASFSANSPEMKKVYALLPNNPLLRSRLFAFRNSIDSGKMIKDMLENHQLRIEWQLKRLYRIRNIATHLGNEMSGTEVAVNHLHNYFDFVVNYMLCKSENGDYVVSTSAVVFETKIDNRIYYEMLKKDERLSSENYLRLLFGPDKNLVNYQFEH